ncbi:hypothetical protein [Paenibacillus tepidiphilus]|uniref:hypothetical protein n=1 Tax=Paenibacillus tepidiphilus TaxID=2608683 RepID=UPI00123B53B3|nr:hypothetical protein [Paenibacillus tepidiphilus]
MYSLKIYYFGIHPRLLDPVSLEFLSFAALWYEENSRRYIVGYGFGEEPIHKLKQFCASTAHYTCNDQHTLLDIYSSLRAAQHEQDWNTRKKLSLLSVFRAPWSGMDTGWYIIRSRASYPCHLSVVQRRKYSIWLEHASVCENEAELAACINKAKEAHCLAYIKLTNG